MKGRDWVIVQNIAGDSNMYKIKPAVIQSYLAAMTRQGAVTA